jgi:hypothetical protein
LVIYCTISQEQLEKHTSDHKALLAHLSGSLGLPPNSKKSDIKQALESKVARMKELESEVNSLKEALKLAQQSGAGKVDAKVGEELKQLQEKHSSLLLEREEAAKKYLKLQKEHDALVASKANDKEKAALQANVTLLETKLKEVENHQTFLFSLAFAFDISQIHPTLT